jgi:hypothetical protein
MKPYSDMTDEELLNDVNAHTGNTTSLALACGIGELATRFKAKCEEVERQKGSILAYHRQSLKDADIAFSLRVELAKVREENLKVIAMISERDAAIRLLNERLASITFSRTEIRIREEK